MLLQFPNEIITHILWRLDKGDIPLAMLVNHRISELTLPVFRNLHFGTLQISFSKANMAQLEKMVSCDGYRQAVRELHLNPSGFSGFFGAGLTWPRDGNGTLKPNVNVERAQSILSASFPKCSSISVLREETSYPEYDQEERILPLRDAVTFLFRAMDQGAFPLVSSFTLDLYPRSPEFGLRQVVRPASDAAGFWACWALLQTLCMNMAWDELGRDAGLASELICRAESLKMLSMEHCLHTTSDADALSIYKLLVTAKDLPRITHLHIGKVSFASSDHLIRLLSCFESSIESLFIEWTSIEQGSWQDVCEALRNGFPNLRSIALAWCKQFDGPETSIREVLQLLCPLKVAVPPFLSRNFSFVESKHHTKYMFYQLSGVRYAGAGKGNMRLALKLIRDAFYTIKSPPGDVPQLKRAPGQERVSRFHDAEFDFINTMQSF